MAKQKVEVVRSSVVVTMGELVQASQPLQVLLGLEMGIVAAHRLSRAARPVLLELDLYEKSRLALFEKYGTKGEDGQWRIEPGGEAYAGFEREFGKLLAMDVDLEVYPVDVADLGEVRVKPSVLGACWFLFSEAG